LPSETNFAMPLLITSSARQKKKEEEIEDALSNASITMKVTTLDSINTDI
jgi:hypothetical protein